MNFLKKKRTKKIISYVILCNLIAYNMTNIAFGLSASITYTPNGPASTSGDVIATLTGDYDTITNNG